MLNPNTTNKERKQKLSQWIEQVLTIDHFAVKSCCFVTFVDVERMVQPFAESFTSEHEHLPSLLPNQSSFHHPHSLSPFLHLDTCVLSCLLLGAVVRTPWENLPLMRWYCLFSFDVLGKKKDHEFISRGCFFWWSQFRFAIAWKISPLDSNIYFEDFIEFQRNVISHYWRKLLTSPELGKLS